MHQSSQILNKNADSKKKLFSYSAGIELHTSECKSDVEYHFYSWWTIYKNTQS